MNLGKIVIADGNAVKARVGGKEKFDVIQQSALLHTSDGQVRKISLNLEEGQASWPVGEYSLGDASLSVDEYGRLGVARSLVLVPVAGVKPLSAVRGS